MKILLFDNYDSFTYNLRDYLEEGGAEVLVVRNDCESVDELLQRNFDAVVLSPGPARPEQSGVLMEFIEVIAKRYPILGVCLGFQALGLHFGAKLVKAPIPVHGKVSEIRLNQHAMFKGLGAEAQVCRYHSLVLESVPEELEITAQTESNLPMAFAHRSLPIWGYQFHPEAILTAKGKEMISLWLKHIENLRVS
ncbi:MAG: aminodeoxychorismate/anthranilate synthase component II [Bacteroidetes bacterium]|nr:MAG: aminodeoxychorismate/anthranilate synthase component II [Bacteroidota bacterium]